MKQHSKKRDNILHQDPQSYLRECLLKVNSCPDISRNVNWWDIRCYVNRGSAVLLKKNNVTIIWIIGLKRTVFSEACLIYQSSNSIPTEFKWPFHFLWQTCTVFLCLMWHITWHKSFKTSEKPTSWRVNVHF